MDIYDIKIQESIDEIIEKHKDKIKDDFLTKKLVKGYLTSLHGHIHFLRELLMNLTTDKNAAVINYDLVEEEFLKYRNEIK